MIKDRQFILECILYSLNLIDFITDIMAIGSLGSKNLVAHLLLVLFTIIIERIAQVIYFQKVIKKKMETENIVSNFDDKKQIIYRACFLDLLLFIKSSYTKIGGTPIELNKHRTYVTYQTQNIHALFSSCACIFFQSHGMIYWGSSDALIIISNVFHIISLGFSNSTTYISDDIFSYRFKFLFTKNIFNLISFFGFWCLASELSRPRFLVAHMFSSIILLILIYFLYTNSQEIPKDQINSQGRQQQTNQQNNEDKNQQHQTQGPKNTQHQKDQESKQIMNNGQKYTFKSDDNQLNIMSIENTNQEHTKEQQNKMINQNFMAKKDNADTHSLNTPNMLKSNHSGYSGNLIYLDPYKINNSPPNQMNQNNTSLQNSNKQLSHEQKTHAQQKQTNNSGDIGSKISSDQIKLNFSSRNENINYQYSNNQDNDSFKNEEDKIKPHINKNESNKQKSDNNLFKYISSKDGDPSDLIIQFESSDMYQQNGQMDITYHLDQQFKQNNNHINANIKNDNNFETMNDNFQKNTGINSPMHNTYVKTEEVPVNKQQVQTDHQNPLNPSQINLELSPEQTQKKDDQQPSKVQIVSMHVITILKFIACVFYLQMNYNKKDAIFSDLEYLNKPLCSFKIANIVFLFTFVVSFNSSDFLPGLRVISIICGVVYLILDIGYLVDFRYKRTFAYEIYKKIITKNKGDQKTEKNQQSKYVDNKQESQ